MGFPGGSDGKGSAFRAGDRGSIPGLEIPWRRAWQPTPGFLRGEAHGQRSLAGYGPRACRVRHDRATNTSQPSVGATRIMLPFHNYIFFCNNYSSQAVFSFSGFAFLLLASWTLSPPEFCLSLANTASFSAPLPNSSWMNYSWTPSKLPPFWPRPVVEGLAHGGGFDYRLLADNLFRLCFCSSNPSRRPT